MRASYVLLPIALSSLLACSAADSETEPTDVLEHEESEGDEALPGEQPEPFAQFETDGHSVYFYEPSPGALLIAERGPAGEAAILPEAGETASLSELYSHFVDGPVPDAITEFDERTGLAEAAQPDSAMNEAASASVGSPELATSVPGLRLNHEAGSSHFVSSHCPTTAHPNVFTGFPNVAPGATYWSTRATETTRINTRTFCWASGFTGSWTESSNSSTLWHTVAAPQGDVCYTASVQGGSQSFTILQGEAWNFFFRNRIIKLYPPCPSNSTCTSSASFDVAPMSGTVGCASSGDVWRFGGTFLKYDNSYWRFDGVL